MDGGSFSSPTPDSLLQDARLLNSDIIGRHSVKCNFSTRLAGRFYQNGSLERHTLRTSRLVEMQAKKRRLERELQLEERRVRLLEERLNETERAREDAHGVIITIERGVVQFQAFVRQRQALRLFRAMKHETFMREFTARYFQRYYRGWKGRLRANSQREYMRQKRRNESAATIQANVRRRSQRKMYRDLLMERKRLSNQSAAAIQAILRGNVTRRMYLEEMTRRNDAASTTQRVWRGTLGRINAERLRQELIRKRMETEKPKRIPLHMRKYSTYGAPARRANNDSTKKRDVRLRRRSSDAMILTDGRLSTLSNFKSSASTCDPDDENDSIATTITSLTNATENSNKRRIHNRRTNPPSWPSPQRVLESKRNSAITRRLTTLQPCNRVNSRRASLPLNGTTQRRPPPGRPPDRQSTIQTCTDSRERQDSDKTDSVPCKRRKSGEEESSPTARGEIRKTPITVSEEASLIVQEVLGKSVVRHSIVHSVFESEFSEHEDDLVGR